MFLPGFLMVLRPPPLSDFDDRTFSPRRYSHQGSIGHGERLPGFPREQRETDVAASSSPAANSTPPTHNTDVLHGSRSLVGCGCVKEKRWDLIRTGHAIRLALWRPLAQYQKQGERASSRNKN